MPRPPAAVDVAVLAQDPRFGGGGHAQTAAFLEGVAALGRRPELLYEPHPGLDAQRPLRRRVEALYQLRAARRLAPRAQAARSLWVVATTAANGAAAPRAGRPYGCWIGTAITSEWRGRAPLLRPGHRLAAGASLPLLRRLERRVLREAAKVYATSAASRAAVAAAAELDEQTIGVLPIPIDAERFAPEPDERWLERLDRPTLVFVGRADDPRKNLPLLLHAFARVRAALPAARLRIVGRPPQSGTLGDGDGIEVAGEVPDVAPLVRTSQLFVLPSRQEGFGIVAAEALACGVPVLTTPCGGPEQLVHESRGGVVLDGFSPEELAATAADLLRDAARLAAMRRSGRAYVMREHSRDEFVRRLATALTSVDAAS